MIMSEPKLLPCPFCGAEAELEETELLGAFRKSAGCSNEGCQGYQATITFATKREAIAAWNTRADCDGPTDAEILLAYHEQQKEWHRKNTNDPHNVSTAVYVMHCELVNIYDAMVSGDAKRNFLANQNK